MPRVDELVAKLSASLDEERTRAHRWIAQLQVEDGRGSRIVAETVEDGAQRHANYWLGKGPWGVEGTTAPPLLVRLEDHGSSGYVCRCGATIDLALYRGLDFVGVCR